MPSAWMERVVARFERDYANDPESFAESADPGPGYMQPPGGWVDEAEGLLGVDSGDYGDDPEAWPRVHGLAFYLMREDEERASA